MYGIPNMKLEKWVIDRKVNVMKEEGITFITNADVGRNYKAAKILRDFDSIILACGASNPRNIDVPGRDAAGIYFAVDFFKGKYKEPSGFWFRGRKLYFCQRQTCDRYWWRRYRK